MAACALPVSAAVLAAPAAPAELIGEAQRAAVLSLGPWPPPARPDPTNRVSGNPRAIELGRLLFRDARMSPLKYVACVTCHQPDRAFTDAKPRAHGLADLPRNTPALFNLRQQAWYGWGGGSDSLWLASIRPIIDSREFGGSAASAVDLFVLDEQMAACYRQVFGVSPFVRPERTLLNVGKAIAAWLETITSGRTPFDEFRDALARGDAIAAAAYPAPARRGLTLFVDAGCASCHAGPNFSDGRFHPGAAAHDAVPNTARDGGRREDVIRLLANPLNLAGAANDDKTGRSAAATRALRGVRAPEGWFRTPSLRNVGVTAPYLHDGRAETLADAIRLHAGPTFGVEQLRDLETFLHTLTDQHGVRRPWAPSQLTVCCR